MVDSDVHGREEVWQEVALLLHSLSNDADAEANREGMPPAPGGGADSHAAAGPAGLHHEEDMAAADAALSAALEESLAALTSCKGAIEQQAGLQAEVASWHDDVRDLTGALNSHVAEVRSGFATLGSDLDGSRHALRQHHVETRATIDGIALETRDRHTHEAQTAFQHLVDALDGRCQRALDDAFREFETHASQAFEHAEHDAQGHGGALGSFFSQLMLESADRITHDTLEEIRRAFGELVRHGIEVLAEEAAAQAVSMMAGSSVTTALAPMLPELAAARAGLHAINEVVDFLTGHE